MIPHMDVPNDEDRASSAVTARPPQHVACIMDGSGRWATRRQLSRIEGHGAAEGAITAVVDAAIAEGVRWLTLFAFSTENWTRPPDEVAFLMEYNSRLIAKHGAGYHRRGIRVRYLGRQAEPVPSRLQEEIRRFQDLTAANSTLNLTLALNYGGRAELVDAVQRLLLDGTPAALVDEGAIASHLQYPEMPSPDLIVRTGGERRLSNFMLWGAAYAELVFLDVLWPDFRAAHFRSALEIYERRRRTFGSLGGSHAESLNG